jgi:hypothetical protein
MVNCKIFGRKRLWPNLSYYPGICQEVLRINIGSVYADCRRINVLLEDQCFKL